MPNGNLSPKSSWASQKRPRSLKRKPRTSPFGKRKRTPVWDKKADKTFTQKGAASYRDTHGG